MTKKSSPSLGGWVCAWIERFLVHSEGDCYAQPFRLIDFHRRFIWKAYELNPDGSRKITRGLMGLPKGNAKTEITAALACAELAGPVRFAGWDDKGKPRGKPVVAPDIPVAAASFEQADELFGSARTMIKEGPLSDFFDVYETEILPKGKPGKMYRVAAAAGTNDGKRPTFLACDELHEWVGNKERVHLVLANGLAKRRRVTGTWELIISTAGWDMSSLLARRYLYGQKVIQGEIDDPKFLFEWAEASRDWDLNDPEQLRSAIREASPAADLFVDVEAIAEKYFELPEHEFRRYFLNQWVSSPDRWIEPELWAERATKREVARGTRVALGFDGSYSGDSTALVGCTVEEKPHIFVIDAWEKDDAHVYDWRVDVLDVEAAVIKACADYQVQAIGCDPHRWQRSMAVLEEKGLPILEWPTHSPARMVPACAQFYEGLKRDQMSHDGDERLSKHMGNAVLKYGSAGPRIVKDHKDSTYRIDLAVASVLAYDLVVRELGQKQSGYYDHGITALG